MQQDDRYLQAKKVTLIGALINALLGFIKLIGGLFFHSHALAADGLHSFSDLITDGMVLFASKYGSQDADATHPYGHQRIETAATLFLALVLALVGAGIAWDSIHEMIHKTHTVPNSLTIPIAILSILANEGLFHYTQVIGRKIQSDLIFANAWHHRSDAASSIVVLFGLIGSLSGFVYLDAIAAIIVGLLIIQMGWTYGWNSVKELVDTAIDPQKFATIKNIIVHVDGVQKVHQLRTRMMGPDIYVDVHILVSPYISVSEGHFIAQHVHHVLMQQFEHIKDVTVHVDPEDDETTAPSLHLPNRLSIEKNLIKPWRQLCPEIQSAVLHYIDGALIIDLFCNQESVQYEELCKRIQADLNRQIDVTKVNLHCKQHEIILAKSGM